MNTEVTIKKLSVSMLKPAKYNPRKDLKPGDPAYEKIKRSLHDFGYVDGLLRETGDEWSATGRINAYPGKQYRFARYYHSLHVEENANPITVPAGTSISVVTPVSFAAATLMFAVPEWTGNDHITVPKIYVNNSLKKLCFTLMNHGSEDAIVTEVELRLMYSGTITGLITESDEEESENSISASNGENVYNQSYITNPDIDGLDE